MENPSSVIDKKLADLKTSGLIADVFMVNGIKLTGIIQDFDETGIILSSDRVRNGIGIERMNVSTVQEHSKEERRNNSSK